MKTKSLRSFPTYFPREQRQARIPVLRLLAVTIASVLGLTSAVRSYSTFPTVQVSLPSEKHLKNIRQLTFGGENAEAYFSTDGKQLIFQSTRDGRECDQIYTMKVDGSDTKLISTGDGRTTCSYFFPNGKRVLYSSTHLGSKQCPERPDFSKGYVWAIYPSFDIFTAKPDGSDLKQLTTTPGYECRDHDLAHRQTRFHVNARWRPRHLHHER